MPLDQLGRFGIRFINVHSKSKGIFVVLGLRRFRFTTIGSPFSWHSQFWWTMKAVTPLLEVNLGG